MASQGPTGRVPRPSTQHENHTCHHLPQLTSPHSSREPQECTCPLCQPPPPPASVELKPKQPSYPDQPNDFFYRTWDKFLALEPKRAKQAAKLARKGGKTKKTTEASTSETNDETHISTSQGLKIQANAASSWDQAAAECRKKVAAIVKECERLNQKYRDRSFDLDATDYCMRNLNGDNIDDADDCPPSGVKRVADIFDDPQFIVDGQTAADINQGHVGDCWLLAAFMSVTAKKELMENLCVARDEAVGVYGFVFFRDGEWIYEVIDDKLLMQFGDDDDLMVVRDWNRSKQQGVLVPSELDKVKESLQNAGTALYFSHTKSNETWLPLIEKAYAKAHGDYCAIEGGWVSEGLEDLTGGVASMIKSVDIMNKDRFWKEQLLQVNDKYLFGGVSSFRGRKGIVQFHAYGVLQAYEEGDLRLLKMKNPWGNTGWSGDWGDGSKLWTPEMMKALEHKFGDDGIFWISYKDFLKHFPLINRTRLFDRSWQVAQQWTSVEVPWTVDYLDTSFEVEVPVAGPAVFVLSQPDSRYFKGLEGRYKFALHFRVKKASRSSPSATEDEKVSSDDEDDEDDSDDEDEEEQPWIVRSLHNSGGATRSTRSVSAEVDDLEPGTYEVQIKIVPIRDADGMTVANAIDKYAGDRKDKLLHVGRRFEYAQNKGNRRETEAGIAKRWKEVARQGELDDLRKERRTTQQERERQRRRKARLDEAKKEAKRELDRKKKEFEEKEKEQNDDEKKDEDESEEENDGKKEKDEESKKEEAEKKEEEEEKKQDGTADDKSKDSSSDSQTESKPDTQSAASSEEKSAESPSKIDEDASSETTAGSKSGITTPTSEDEARSEAQRKNSNEPGTVQSGTAAVEALSAGLSNVALSDSSSSSEQTTDEASEAKANDKEEDGDAAPQASTSGEPSTTVTTVTVTTISDGTQSSTTTKTEEGESSAKAEAPDEEIPEFADEDFDWDSEIDGPIPLNEKEYIHPVLSKQTKGSSTTVDGVSEADKGAFKAFRSSNGTSNALFSEDPWNAICVVGLRVYVQGEKQAEVRILRPEEEVER